MSDSLYTKVQKKYIYAIRTIVFSAKYKEYEYEHCLESFVPILSVARISQAEKEIRLH